MQTINLYRYTRENGGITTSPVKPDAEHIELFRLIADEGYVLTNGETTAICIDTDNPNIWKEIEDFSEMSEIEQKARGYDIITGVSV